MCRSSSQTRQWRTVRSPGSHLCPGRAMRRDPPTLTLSGVLILQVRLILLLLVTSCVPSFFCCLATSASLPLPGSPANLRPAKPPRKHSSSWCPSLQRSLSPTSSIGNYCFCYLYSYSYFYCNSYYFYSCYCYSYIHLTHPSAGSSLVRRAWVSGR